MTDGSPPCHSPAADVSPKAHPERVLGVDLASVRWQDVSSAVIEFERAAATFTRVVVPAIQWPSSELTPEKLANAIDAYARAEGVSAVALDGPQGWRDPQTPSDLPGVGRRCEYLCRTQGKTGVPGHAYPANGLAWTEFSIEVFARLLASDGVALAKPGEGRGDYAYLVIECFPTSAWRSSCLAPLPGKRSKPSLEPHRSALARAYGLPHFEVASHDDLQAVVAALCAVGAVGGPAVPWPKGTAARIVDGVRAEGLIWDVGPVGRGSTVLSPAPVVIKGLRQATPSGTPTVYVTPGVVAQVNRAGSGQMQIALSGLPGGTKSNKVRVELRVEGQPFVLAVGDTHAAWRSHQTPDTLSSFEELFALAADTPGRPLRISKWKVVV